MIHFVDETHQYFDGDKELISVTTLMQKHGLAPDYSGVSTDVLRKAAEKGKIVHAEIEDYCKKREAGFTDECAQFIDYFAENIDGDDVQSEFIVHNDICAGTVDLMYKDKNNGEYVLADNKTTYSLHKDAVSWQLSIYNYLIGWKADKLIALHFHDGRLTPVEIKQRPKEEVERLMQCERDGTRYHITDIMTATISESLLAIQREISEIEEMKRRAEEKLNNIKEYLILEMEKNGIKSYENDFFKITYIAPKTTTRIDVKRLEQELPELVKQYKTESISKPSMRITPKKEEKNE